MGNALNHTRSFGQKLRDWLAGRPRPEPRLPPPVPFPDSGDGQEVIGICCSGGGIRSAAYNLGALQVLKERGVLDRAQYLSAVSGGSYIAASHAIVARYSEPGTLDGEDVFARGSPEEQYLRNHSTYIAPGFSGKVNLVLRLFGGMALNIALIAVLLFLVARPLAWAYTREIKLFGVHLMCPIQPGLAVQPGLELLPFSASQSAGCSQPAGVVGELPIGGDALDETSVSVAVRKYLWPVGLVALISLSLGMTDLVGKMPDAVRRATLAWARRLALTALAMLVFLVVIPILVRFTRVQLPGLMKGLIPLFDRAVGLGRAAGDDVTRTQGSTGATILTILVSSGLVAAVFRVVLARRARFAPAIGAILGPLLVLGLFLRFLNDATAVGARSMVPRDLNPSVAPEELLAWATLAGLLLGFSSVADLTRWSGHPFYKRRLASAFALQRVGDAGGAVATVGVGEIPYDELLRLSCSHPPAWTDDRGMPRPELIVCAAANVTDRGVTPPGRNAATFTFTADRLGGPLVGYEKTAAYEKVLGGAPPEDPCDSRNPGNRGQDFTLLAAVAMSGAALSPSMGKMTRRSVQFLMALANLRLGVWMPNPRWMNLWREITNHGAKRAPIRVRPRIHYLVKELLGLNRLNDKFLYVTDGGHYENLGLVELLRRRCTTIYCFDASGGEGDQFFTLGEAVEIARSDLTVEIDIETKPLVPDPATGLSASTYAVGTFRYRDTDLRGRLVYFRTTLTESAPVNAHTYRGKNALFPHDPTSDQFFDEEQFEAYRSLGDHAARQAVPDLGPPLEAPTLLIDVTAEPDA